MSIAFGSILDLMHNPPESASGTLTLTDIDLLLESMYNNARTEPDMLYISVKQYKRIRHWERVGRLYHTHPMPDYPIRKCVRRRIQNARNAGMKRIRKMELREEAQEALERAIG